MNTLGEPMQRLLRIAQQPERLIIGLNSGTSADGIDAALVRFSGNGPGVQFKLLAFEHYSYPAEIRRQLLRASLPGQGTVDQICRLNVAVGECFAQAALALAQTAGIATAAIDLIGSHGQTIHHLPNAEAITGVATRGTLQIGEASVIARRTGIITIADFRAADMALGGQGAPLVPLLEFLLLRSPEKTRGVLNLGGIANLTLLKKGGSLEEVRACDTGPGNMVIDGLMQKLFAREFDANGAVAASGRVSAELLQQLLQHPYFSRPLPKTTGREEFGQAFIEQAMLGGLQHFLAHEDIVATATALTVETIWRGAQLLQEHGGPIEELVVSGGGAQNPVLMQELRRKFAGVTVITSSELGIPSEAKEAILFALLANETVSGHAGNVPAVTGAAAATVLGKICL
ncbi:MAG: anhydro-N-acetylmuramic acid kinase [candidate division KSB1 bacterium]|nr:anhydro-N-acetylmuramic acid kinase [candidate division KSB1 bacterium]MDZ7288281.1 anhydro-N-acetylmuramic acid kinase [candidate division KSB1 bacterium]MDZ7300495.1 anhydro-N-acetylmuramic acid kinase [candidate division KSB1 bacterium]MDZ7308076.1 anhydro-N-acetylmuramic acid kinase [candidate division KSB1 bacterium]MDZ7351493.1 anhydro-N-acetylmuramic acid kinase [candidate division KSB1 bacterium]